MRLVQTLTLVASLGLSACKAHAGGACPTAVQLGARFSTDGLQVIGPVLDSPGAKAYIVEMTSNGLRCGVNVSKDGLLIRIIERQVGAGACDSTRSGLHARYGSPARVDGKGAAWSLDGGVAVAFMPGPDGDCSVHTAKPALLKQPANRPSLDVLQGLDTADLSRFLRNLEALPLGTDWVPNGAIEMPGGGDARGYLVPFPLRHGSKLILMYSRATGLLETVGVGFDWSDCSEVGRKAQGLNGVGLKSQQAIGWRQVSGANPRPARELLVIQDKACMYSVGALD